MSRYRYRYRSATIHSGPTDSHCTSGCLRGMHARNLCCVQISSARSKFSYRDRRTPRARTTSASRSGAPSAAAGCPRRVRSTACPVGGALRGRVSGAHRRLEDRVGVQKLAGELLGANVPEAHRPAEPPVASAEAVCCAGDARKLVDVLLMHMEELARYA